MRKVLLTALLLAASAPANAAWLPLNGSAPIRMKTAHRMAERWAAQGEPTRHTTTCWRTQTAVKCRIVYRNATQPVQYNQGGRWVAPRGPAHETVTVRRHRHRLVLTSDLFRGRLTQRG